MTETAPRHDGAAFATDRPAWLVQVFRAVLASGIALRIWEFILNRGFHGDEAMLALNLRARTFAGLLEPLDYHQGAPIGFLWIEKLMFGAGAGSEPALRLWPLAMGIATLALFARWAWTRLDPWAATGALAILAIGRYPILYSVFSKQYAGDMLAAVLLVVLLDRIGRLSPRTWRYWGLVLAGAATLAFSYPAVFVIAGAGGAYLAFALARRDGALFWRVAGFCAITATAFLIEYWLLLRHLTASQFLLDWWGYGFMPLPPKSWSDLGWFSERIASNLRAYTTTITLAVAPWIMLAGLIALFRRDRLLFGVLLMPVLAVLAASALKLYPFAGRMVLFLYPAGAILLALGAVTLARFASRWIGLRAGLIVMTVVVFAPQTIGIGKSLAATERPYDLPPMMERLAANLLPGDCVAAHYHAWPAFEYYRQRYGLDDPKLCVVEYQDWLKTGRAEYLRLRGGNRVWFLFAHLKPEQWRAELATHIDSEDRELSRVEADEAALYLYELNRP